MIASSNPRVGAVVLALMWPAAALADPPPTAAMPPTEEQVQAARGPYHEARELHRQGKLKEALERALEAYRTAATPVTALEAGQLLVERGRLVEARDVVRSIAAFAVSPRESEKGREARQDAATLAATLDARIPKVAIAGCPPGSDVSLDGKPLVVGDPTAWLGVDPGAHALVVRSGDRPCASVSVTLAEAETRTLDLRDATAPCRKESPVAVTTESPAARALAAAPPPPRPEASPTAEPPPEKRDSGSGWRWAGVAIAGAGVAGVAAGGAIALTAKGSYDSVASECPPVGCTTAGYGARESARSQADVATGVMIGGAMMAAGGVMMFALAPKPAGAVLGLGPASVRVTVTF